MADVQVRLFGANADGTPGDIFFAIHILAIIALTLSLIFSIGVLIYLGISKNIRSFFKWTIGERLVCYLALADLCFSFFHTLDHAWMLSTRGHPPPHVCRGFAFFVSTFALLQAFLVIFTAFNAFLMVVVEKKIHLGKYDWKFIVYLLVLPFVISVVGVSVPFLGPSGAWCNVDMGKSYGKAVSNIYSVAMLLTMVVNVVCYGSVWGKLRQAAKTQVTQKGQKYHRTARVMMLFVVSYVAQWWAYVVYATWGLFTEPTSWWLIVAAFFSNMGGVFNFLAYTFIKTKYQRQTAPSDGTAAGIQQGTTSSS